MNSRWATIIAACLVAFASLVITWQVRHFDGSGNEPNESLKHPIMFESVVQSFLRGERLAEISDISERENQITSASGRYRHLDLVLPKDARIFLTDMTGSTNHYKIGYFYWAKYYLFPREIETSLDHITRLTKDGFVGQTSESDQEILAHGFDVRIDHESDQSVAKGLHKLSIRDPGNPDWFDSKFDLVIAFLLPLLTALAGMWLFRFLFPSLSKQMPLLEQMAYSLGLGMMAVAALTLGVKLCGFSGRSLILVVTAVGSSAEIWRDRKALLTGIAGCCRDLIHSPVVTAILVAGLLVFLILFRLAGLQGLVELDAVESWLLKAKIIHLYSGSELVQWFNNPCLPQANFDYPTLVPSLHSATYDSLGHVDEFVTKFWPAWMLLFLIAAVASLNRAGKSWFHAPSFALLGVLLLPATQMFAQREGGTLPIVFFTVLGFVQCALWLMGKDRARLGLGLTLLFGAAMAKNEGFIFLALVGSWMLLLPSARPSFKPSPRFWQVLAFWFLSALPFVCLRVQIPVLYYYEAGWAGLILHNPGITLSSWPSVFMIMLARLFVNSDFAHWSGEDGHLHWVGKWDGFSSLYNHLTLGLAWLCLLMTIALWFAVPARRRVIFWILAMFISAVAALSGVFVSFVTTEGLNKIIQIHTNDLNGGRYLFPILLAWFATMMTLFFYEPPSDITADRSLPELKHGYWLALGAFLILAWGVFVLPENEPDSPENPLSTAAATSFLNNSETNPPKNPDPDLQTKMELAVQLDKAGKFAEAVQAYREIVRLHPNDPIALNNLAWRLAANPRLELRNGREAVQLAGKAVDLTGWQQPVLVGTLAAAYAEDGQFAKAVETATKARDIALSLHQPEVAAANEQLIKLYSAGKTFDVTNGP
ncbi:MAG: hypothetical protein WBN75_14845 [Verrucomicrobiia bacterium]